MSSSESELILKAATLEDLPHILHYAEKFWAMSPWKDASFSETKVVGFAKSYLDSDLATIFVHDKGIIGGQIVPLFFGDGAVAHETFWFADSQGKLLLECFEDWAKEMGAEKIMLSSLAFGNKRDRIMTNFYDKLGYTPIEMHFAKEVA